MIISMLWMVKSDGQWSYFTSVYVYIFTNTKKKKKNKKLTFVCSLLVYVNYEGKEKKIFL